MALQDFENDARKYLNEPPPDFANAQPIQQDENGESEGPGIVKSFIDAALKPVRGLGNDLAELDPVTRSVRRDIEDLRASGDLEKIKQADMFEEMIGQKPTVKKVIGDVIGTALTAVPLPVAKLNVFSKIASPFIKTAINGGGYVAAFNAADALADDESVGEIAKAAGVGAIEGSLTFGLGYLGTRGFTRMASLKPLKSFYGAITETEAAKTISRFVRPVGSVLEKDFGEYGKQISDRLLKADRNVQTAMGRIIRVGDEVGAFFGKDDAGRETAYQLGRLLRGKVAGEAGGTAANLEKGTITGRIKKIQTTEEIPGLGEMPVEKTELGTAVREGFGTVDLPDDIKALTPEQYYRTLFSDVAAEADARGTMIRIPATKDEAAHWVKFEPMENYFPQQVPNLDELKAVGKSYGGYKFKNVRSKIAEKLKIKTEDGRLRKWVLRRAVDDGEFRSLDEAAQTLDSYIDIWERNGAGISKNEAWIQYMVKSGQADSPGDAVRIMQGIIKNESVVKLGGSLEQARVVNNPFYNPFPDEVAPLYAMDSITRLENIDQFGVKYQGESAKLPLISKAIDQIRNSEGSKAAENFRKFLDVAMNRIDNATEEAKLSYYLRMSQVPKLSYAQIVNVGQAFLNPLLKTDAASTFYGLSRAFTNEGVKRSLESGATLQSIFNEQVRATAAGGNFADKLLKVTGFIWTEKFNRTVASNAGIKWAERNFERVLKGGGKGNFARMALEELGIDVERAMKRGSLTVNEKLKAGQIIAEKTQFRSRPMDLPIFASSPAGKWFWQFKNFIYNQTGLVFDSLAGEVKRKNYGRAARNLLVLSTIFPMTSEVLLDVRSLVTQSKRPTGALDRYLQDIAGAGGMGIIADFLDAARFDRFDELIVSPSAASIGNIFLKAPKELLTGNPDKFLDIMLRETGVLSPIVNARKESSRDYKSTVESLIDMLQ